MKLIEQSIGRYSELLASDFPTPGGGSTAALNGVLGCSFIIKIARITLKKPGFAGNAALLQRIISQSESLRQELFGLVDEDTAAYNGIMAALAMRHSRADEQGRQREHLGAALKTAVETPCRILQASLAALELARLLGDNYYAGTASDLALAALNLETAARGAYLTVRINLNHLADTCAADTEYIQRYDGESAGRLVEAEGMANRIYDGVTTLLCQGR
jgi:formiminotetrahydrofolate cyclodeaminase